MDKRSNLFMVMVVVAATVGIIAAPACAKTTFALHSNSFAAGGAIPQKFSNDGFGCTGRNVSPELHWSGAPAGTKSFALTVFDPDANDGKGWWHWVVYNIRPGTSELPEGVKNPGLQGSNDFGKPSYGGPCPPPGDPPHHYVFTLYALDVATIEANNGPDVVKGIKSDVLAKAVLVGRFGH